MIALLSAIVGLVSSIFPSFVRAMERRQELKHEIELTRLRMDAAAQGLQFSTTMADIKAIIDEGVSLRTHDSSLNGGQYMETLRASIRPVLTYSFFILFVSIKSISAWVMFHQNINTTEILATIWDDQTMAIFCAIISFWFGSRSITRFQDYIRNPSTIKVKPPGGK